MQTHENCMKIGPRGVLCRLIYFDNFLGHDRPRRFSPSLPDEGGFDEDFATLFLMQPCSRFTLLFLVTGISTLIVGACASGSGVANLPAASPQIPTPALPPASVAAAPATSPVSAPMAAMPAPSTATPAPSVAPPVAATLPAPTASKPIASTAAPVTTAGKVDFSQQVKPFFEAYCYQCHGLGQGRGGVRLDDRANALMHVTSGDPDRSDVYRAITRSWGASDHMPPVTEDQPDDSEIAMIKQWIIEGATWPDASSEK
jgi:mono/diheme cytochrome c family protein